mgnify:FL=1
MTLVKWKPMSGVPAFASNWDSMFNRLFDSFPTHFGYDDEQTWAPKVHWREDSDSYHIDAEVPGFRKSDIGLTFENGVLTLSGEIETDEKKGENRTWHRTRFSRSLRLPESIDAEKIKAKVEDGILTVDIPKSEMVKAVEIPVR